MFGKWCMSTSLDGMSELYESKKKKPHFIFWICVMIVMFGLTVLLVATNIMSFINSPTVTNIETVVVHELQMPEILLCYKGGLNVQKLKSYNLSDELMFHLQDGYFPKSIDKVFKPHVVSINTSLVEKEFEDFRDKFKLNVQQFYEQIAAHDCQDIILNRQIAGYQHYQNSICSNVSNFVSQDTYSCLHLKENGHQITSNPIAGGLQMTISPPKGAAMENRDYFDFTNSFTMALDNSFFVQGDINIEIPLGYKLTILLTLTKFARLSTSRPCYQKKPGKFQTGGCGKSSLYNITSANCNCTVPGVRLFRKENFTVDVCSVFQFRNVCLDKWQKVVLDTWENMKQICLPQCEEYVYGTSLSFIPLKTKNITKINLGYSHLQYTKIEEVAAFTWDVAVANVGGQAGLWMGCSVVTLVQALFYLGRCICSKQAPNMKN